MLLTTILLAPLALQDVSFEEALIATIPAGYEIEGAPFIGPDGKEYPNRNRIVWSPDGRRCAYVAMKDGKSWPVDGETVAEAWDFVDPPVFDPSGAHLGWRLGVRKSKKAEVWHIVVEGRKWVEDDWCGNIAVRSDGQAAVWKHPGTKVLEDGTYSREKGRFTTPFKPGKKWDDSLAIVQAPIFSADGETVLSAGMDNGQWFPVVARKKGGEKRLGEGDPMIQGLALSANGKRVGWWAPEPGLSDMAGPFGGGGGPRLGLPFGKSVVRIDGEKKPFGRSYDGAGCLCFSPDGVHFAYKIARGEKMGVAIDDDEKAETPWAFVTTPVWSADGARIAFAANEGGRIEPTLAFAAHLDSSGAKGGKERLMVLSRKGSVVLTGEPWLRVKDPVFDPAGERVAFGAREADGWRVRCGDKASEAFEELGPAHWSPDGSKLAFGARRGREILWKVLEL